MNEKIINKILNLLNRTEKNGATKHEAEIALRTATELMTKYEITEHELKKVDRSSFSDKAVKLFRMDITTLFTRLAKTFDCEFYYYSGIREGHFFGFEIDVKLCVHFAQMLSALLSKEIREYKKSSRYKELTCIYQEKMIIRNFVAGYCDELRDKLIELEESKKQIIASSNTSLMVIKHKQVADEFKRLNPDIKIKDDSELFFIKSVFLTGAERAESVNFNNPVESGKENLLQITKRAN